jgi:hypothetical protein
VVSPMIESPATEWTLTFPRNLPFALMIRNTKMANETEMVVYIPFSIVEKTVTKTPAKKIGTSSGDTRQNWYTVFGGVMRSPTA